MKKTVALLFGGRGEEHGISCRSAAAVYKNLSKERYSVLPIGIDRDGDFFLIRPDADEIPETDFRKQKHLKKTFPIRLGGHRGFVLDGRILPVDVALLILHGRGGEDGEVQGLLSAAGIPFVGCDCAASALCFDKEYTKVLAERAGVPTAPFVSVPRGTEVRDAERLTYAFFSPEQPLFIKPAAQGSSIGASVAWDRQGFARAYDLARAYGKVLVESYIGQKTELEVAMLEKEGRLLFCGPGAVECGAPLYSFDEKYEGGSCKVSVRASITDAQRDLLFSYSARLASVLSLSSLARLDFFLTPDGQILFNEVNTLPGFTKTSLYPRLWEEEGLSFPSLLDVMIGEAIDRASR